MISRRWRHEFLETNAMKAPLRLIATIGTMALISACDSNRPTERLAITDAEVTEILVKSVKAASIKFSKAYCLDPKLEQETPLVWPTTSDPDGWITSPSVEIKKYRPISSSPPRRLPDVALKTFGEDRVRTDCRHTLVFTVPEIMEVSSSGKSSVEAVVSLSDRCPTCGAGFNIHLKKTDASWYVVPDGIQNTWIS